jgi:hypothetical protein
MSQRIDCESLFKDYMMNIRFFMIIRKDFIIEYNVHTRFLLQSTTYVIAPVSQPRQGPERG